MALLARRKIVKEKGQVPDAFEEQIASYLLDLEQSSSELKSELRHLQISSAKEIDVGNKKAVILVVPYKLLQNFHRVQPRLVHELEKKLSGKQVVVVAQRRILPKVGRNNRVKQQKRPVSRTLTAVHDAILEDVVYPCDITGKRLRYKLDGSKMTKVYLDKKDQPTYAEKLETFATVYRKLTGKTAVFTFQSQNKQ